MNKCLRYPSKLLLLASLATILSLASAAARTTVILGKYYEDSGSNVCSNDTNCLLTFAPVPGDKTVLITHVSCRFESGAAEIQFVELATKSLTRFDFLTIFPNLTTGSAHTYTAAVETGFLLGPGGTPAIFVQLGQSSTIVVVCRISGERPSPL